MWTSWHSFCNSRKTVNQKIPRLFMNVLNPKCFFCNMPSEQAYCFECFLKWNQRLSVMKDLSKEHSFTRGRPLEFKKLYSFFPLEEEAHRDLLKIKKDPHPQLVSALSFQIIQALNLHIKHSFGPFLFVPSRKLSKIHFLEVLARCFQKEGFIILPFLQRKSALSLRQQKNLSEKKRSNPHSQRFYLQPKGISLLKKLSSKQKEHLIIFDDVVTTGSTLKEISVLMKKDLGIDATYLTLSYVPRISTPGKKPS